MVADVSESEEWKEIDESMGRCQTVVCREVDGVEAERRRQMAVKVEDGRRTMYRWVDVRQLFVGKRRIRERRVKRQSIERQRSGGM